MAGAEIAIRDTNVSRAAQMVELLISLTLRRERIQRRRAAVMTKIPEERRRPMTIFRESGSLTTYRSGMGIDRMLISVLFG